MELKMENDVLFVGIHMAQSIWEGTLLCVVRTRRSCGLCEWRWNHLDLGTWLGVMIDDFSCKFDVHYVHRIYTILCGSIFFFFFAFFTLLMFLLPLSEIRADVWFTNREKQKTNKNAFEKQFCSNVDDSLLLSTIVLSVFIWSWSNVSLDQSKSLSLRTTWKSHSQGRSKSCVTTWNVQLIRFYYYVLLVFVYFLRLVFVMFLILITQIICFFYF